MPSSFILASASPRRLELLRQIQIKPDITMPAEIDETALEREKPHECSYRLAKEKAYKISKENKKSWVLSADTIVACGQSMLPKATDTDIALLCLKKLSGRRHNVLTSVCIVNPKGDISVKTSKTIVAFKRLSPREIDHYIKSKEWEGKAGGYAIQGYASAYIKFIRGSYSNVMGLPLYEVSQMLNGLGYEWHR